MPYIPDIDNITDEDEDVKIWRGAVETEAVYDESADKKQRRKSADKGRHAKQPANKPATEKLKTDTFNFASLFFTYIDRYEFLFSVLAAALMLVVGMLPFEGWKLTAVYFIPFVVAAFPAAQETLQNILNVKMLNRVNMVLIAGLLCFYIGEYWSAVLIFILLYMCRWLEGYAVEKKKTALADIRDLSAERARVETLDGVQTVGPEYIEIGDIIEVLPGERISHDGVVVDGISALDISPLTGTEETIAVNKGHKVCAGSVNISSKLRLEVTEVFEESTSFRIAEMIYRAEQDSCAEEKLIFKVEKYFTPLMALASLICGLLIPMLTDGEWTLWLGRAAALLVISSIASLTMSVPLAFFASLFSAAKKGILIKSSDILSRFAKTDTIVLDKTGTVTEGHYTVKEVFPVGITEEQLLAIAATAESNSKHAIARALKNAGEILKVDVLTAEEIPGRGVSAFINGRHAVVGNAAMLEEHNIKYAIPSRPGAAVHVALDGKYCGHILIADRVRAGTLEALDRLRTQGVKKLVMLTGDVLSVARPIANKLNFDMLRAELMPKEKAAAVAYLTDNCPLDRAMVFVGDGISDYTSLKKADIGIAINSLGRDEAVDNADIAIMDGEIRKLPLAMQVAIFAKRIMLENVVAAAAVKAIILLFTFTAGMPILAAIILDSVCFAALTVNSLRAFKDWDVINYIQKVIL